MGIRYLITREGVENRANLNKFLLFFNTIPKNLNPGDLIEFAIKGESHQPVIGNGTFDSFIAVQRSDGKWPTCGCYPFLEFYTRNILKNKEMADHIKDVFEEFEYNFEKYKYGFIMDFIFSKQDLDNIRNFGEPIDTWKIHDFDKVRKILDDREESHKLQKKCDEWLEKMGLYDELGETSVKYGLVVKNFTKHKYECPSDHIIKNWSYI